MIEKKPKSGDVLDRKRAGTIGAAKSPWSSWNRQFASGNAKFQKPKRGVPIR